MKSVFIVDQDSAGLAKDLNVIANRERLEVRFKPIASPERMFLEAKDIRPDLILLHHHWPGLTIAQLLERVANEDAQTRVIVFTGQAVDISELIACVRFGVADYWTKRGSLDPTVVFRQISNYCSSAVWTIEKLRMPSGSLQQLLVEAEKSLEQVNALTKSRDELQSKLTTITDSRPMVRMIAKLLISAGVLTGAVILLDNYSRLGTGGILGFVAILALFFLLLEGKIAEALFKSKRWFARVKSK